MRNGLEGSEGATLEEDGEENIAMSERSRLKIVNIIDLVTSILDKWTPNLAIQDKMVNETINFT